MGTTTAVGIAMIGLVDAFGAPTSAEPTDGSADPISVETSGDPLAGTSTSPGVSDDGSIVVFSHVGAPLEDGAEPVHSILVRNRTTEETTRLDAGLDATTAAISGDGCTVAYTGVAESNDDAALVVELRIVDVCVAEGFEPVTTVLGTTDGEAALPTPAVSQDGSVTIWPVDNELRRYTEGVDDPPFEVISAGLSDHVVGPRFDMSADGAVVAFESGPSPADDPATPFSPTPSTVWVWTGGNPVATQLAPAQGGSSWPTISADGNTVIYQSDSPTLFADAPATGTYLILADRSVEGAAQRVLTANASHADLAGSALLVVYDTAGSDGSPGAVRIRRSESDIAFGDSTEIVASSAVSGFGESVGLSATRPVLSGNGELVLFDSVAGVDLIVDVTKAAQFAVDAHVWARRTNTIFDPIPEPTTTTSSVATTAPATTLPIGTAPATTAAPRTTTRNTTRNTTRTTTRRTTTTTTTVLALPTVFEPAAFEFAPTIVIGGRRTADVELVNPSGAAVSVSEVRIDPATDSGFKVVSTTCVGALPAASRCVVSLEFLPGSTGETTANLVAELDDGALITSALRGVGAPEPTLSVLPDVASAGQVVTVFGSGFPAGLNVQFSWNDGRVRREIVVDDVGGFAETLVVLPSTTGGPVELRVAGQTDLFDDVETTMLVSNSASRSGPAVHGGIGAGIGS